MPPGLPLWLVQQLFSPRVMVAFPEAMTDSQLVDWPILELAEWVLVVASEPVPTVIPWQRERNET